MSPEPVKRPPRSAPGGSTLPANPTLLLVDDEEALRRVLERVLVRAGMKLLVAPSAPAALEQLRGHEGALHLALCDLHLPGIGGWELARRLQELRPGLPVLFMSGFDRSTAGERGLVPPAEIYRFPLLQKPFSMGELLHRLEGVMQLPSGE